MRHAAMETEAIADYHERRAVWLPRILYSLVAIKITAGILLSGVLGRASENATMEVAFSLAWRSGYRGAIAPLSSENTISTRRFSCRPVAVSLPATG